MNLRRDSPLFTQILQLIRYGATIKVALQEANCRSSLPRAIAYARFCLLTTVENRRLKRTKMGVF